VRPHAAACRESQRIAALEARVAALEAELAA
jgi:BMFP domain-containing protein YqiC